MRFLVTFSLMIFSGFSFAQVVEKVPFVLGHTVSVYSNNLKENRELNIYLPPDYDSSDVSYPVIYLLDGSKDEDFIHVTGLVNFLNFSWIDLLPKSIIVGISNVDRKRDFTFPTTIGTDKTAYPTTGHSEEFISFIEKELQPFIDLNYRTNKSRSIIGQSLGGLLATEILIKKPELFQTYYIVSPSLWWDKESLLEKIKSDDKRIADVFIGVGDEPKPMLKDARTLNKLLKKNYPLMNVKFNYFKDEDHGTILHTALYYSLPLFRETIVNIGQED